MNRVLQLQAMDDFGGPTDGLQSQSSCSFLMCGVCSSTSEAGCSGSEDEINAV